jgi:hypothetical protein
MERATLHIAVDDTTELVDAFVSGLQAGHDRRDADVLNRQFATDISWGTPYGALVDWFDQLHPIHVRPTITTRPFRRWPCTCWSSATASGGLQRGRTRRCGPEEPSRAQT